MTTTKDSTPVAVLTPEDNGSSKGSGPEWLPDYLQGKNPDFVLVWNESSKGATKGSAYHQRSIFEFNLEEEGLILDWENSESDPNLHCVKIWAPLEVLKRYSEVLKVRLPIKAVEETDETSQNTPNMSYHTLKGSASTISNIKSCWKDFSKFKMSLNLDPNIFPEVSKKLTWVYSRDKEHLFDVDTTTMHDVFPLYIRSRIVHYILRRNPYKTGEELEQDDFAFGYERLVQKKTYECGYPLHDGSLDTPGSTRYLLAKYWAKLSLSCKHQPLSLIKDYFGVNIALYFAWLGYYTGMLAFASAFGLISFLFGMASVASDEYIEDLCDKKSDFVMCPVCDEGCPYWHLSDKCAYSRLAHLFDNDFSVAFAILMSIWTACFLEFWKRYSARMTYRWDLTTFDTKDFTPRPEYVVALKKAYPEGRYASDQASARVGPDGQVTENVKKFDFDLTLPFWKKTLPFRILSYSAVLLIVVLVVSGMTGVIVYRLWFQYFLTQFRDLGNDNDIVWDRLLVSASAATLNLIFIVGFSRVYEKVALKLTEFEIPRTQAEFDASYNFKIYLLQFINNYGSIFYMAFFKGAYTGHPQKYNKMFGKFRQEECGISCMPELCIQLVIIMVGKQAKSMIMEAFLPCLKRNIKRMTTRLKISSSESGPDEYSDTPVNVCPQWLEDYDLLDPGNYLLSDEYLEMVLQFGFVTIFVSAFPLAPIFALLNNMLELRIDASKMLRHYRRPIGMRVKDIGIWSDIIEGIVKIAILSNACIIAITSNFIPKLMYRWSHYDKTDPNYGTLKGYLNYTLTAYSTGDLEHPQGPSVTLDGATVEKCHYRTYRHDYTSERKYEFTMDHWQIWFARIVFVLVYENVVALVIYVLRWIIPDIPVKVQRKIQYEQRLVNELILKHELERAKKHSAVRAHPVFNRRNDPIHDNKNESQGVA